MLCAGRSRVSLELSDVPCVTSQMLALRANRSVLRSAPALARHLRATTPALKSAVTTTTTGGAVVDPTRYFDGESLVEHQARTRVSSPSNRTYNYALIGAHCTTALSTRPPWPPSPPS